MTIYILSQDHAETAKWLDDRALDKMIKSVSQVLCNVHHLQSDYIDNHDYFDDSIPMVFAGNKETTLWEKWTLQCRANYLLLVKLAKALIGEYLYRFQEYENLQAQNKCKRIDKYHDVILWARDNVPDLPDKICPGCEPDCFFLDQDTITKIPIIMPKKYVSTIPRRNWPINTNMKAKLLPVMEVDAFESYRNYYQNKVKNNIYKKRCVKFGDIHEKEVIKNGECSYCMSRGGYIDIEAKWTRREKPEWLNLEGV